MKEPKFIKLFQTLSKREKNDFERYIEGALAPADIPYRVFHFLIKEKLELQLPDLSTEAGLNQFFSGNKNPSKSLSNTFSDLLKHLEDFLLIRKLKENDHQVLQQQLLYEIYRERHVERQFQSTINKAIKAMKEKPNKDEKDFLRAMQQSEFRFYNTLTHRVAPETDINNCMHYLDRFYVAKKLKFAAEMRNREKVYNTEYHIHLENEIKAYFAILGLQNSPVSTLFYLALKMHEEETENSFFALKAKFLSVIDLIDQEYQHIFLSYLLNFTNQAVRNGWSHFLAENFELTKLGVERKAFISDDYISQIKFINIVQSGSSTKNFDWTRTFIKSHKKYLPKVDKQATLTICEAIIQFEQGDFDDVIDTLQFFNNKNWFLHIRGKVLLIQAFYEKKGANQFIENTSNTLKTYLNRKTKANPDFIQSCKNFLRFTRKLLDVNAALHKQKLQNELAAVDKISFKIWLKEKIDAL